LVDKRPSHFPDTEFDKKIFQSFTERCEMVFFFKVNRISVFLKNKDNIYRRRKEEEGQRRMEKDKKKKTSWFLWKKMGMMTTQENDDNFIERRWSNVDKTDDNSSFKRRQSDNSSLKRRRNYKTNDISSLKRRKIDNSSSKRRSSKEDKNEEAGLTFRLKKIASRVSKMFLSTFFPFASI